MELNFILFPAPKSTYTHADPNLIYIPNGKSNVSKTSLITSPRNNSITTLSTEGTNYSVIASKMKKSAPLFQKYSPECKEDNIPCLMITPKEANNNIGIYFHSNGEDVMLAKELMVIIAPEYPGYGVHSGKSTQDLVMEQAETVYRHLIAKNEIPEKRIVVFGRSIGCAPAIHIASKFTPGALVLVSPFSSIQKMANQLCCTGTSVVIKEKFQNIEKSKRCKSPCLIIHGMKDRLISWTHSRTLYENYGGSCEMILPEEMDHSCFDYDQDLGNPVFDFMEKLGFFSASQIEETPKFIHQEKSETSSVNS